MPGGLLLSHSNGSGRETIKVPTALCGRGHATDLGAPQMVAVGNENSQRGRAPPVASGGLAGRPVGHTEVGNHSGGPMAEGHVETGLRIRGPWSEVNRSGRLGPTSASRRTA